VTSADWGERRDLADTYLDWGGHAYGRKHHGEEMRDLFKRRLSELDVTVKNHDSRELDILDNDDDFMYLGGMIAAVKEYGGKDPVSFVGDSSNPEAPVLRTVAEESRFLFRSRILNPKWLEGLKPHRYRGAQELSALVDFAFGWDATSGILEDWQYRSLAETFLFDESCRAWLAEDNPHALMHMAGRLLEAVDRGMWEPDAETLGRLRSLYLSVESTLESMTGPGR
jgi:cobaltochelatase CobN